MNWYMKYHGDSWEEICNVLLYLKYEHEYQPISDKGGDMGIDGVVLSAGTAFQAYGIEPENKNPAQTTKNKIHADLTKLKSNEKEISEILGKAKIKIWILLLNRQIPHSSIHSYVKKKEAEVKDWQLSIIDPEFRVVICDPTFLETEYMELKKRQDSRIEINIEKPNIPTLDVLKSNEKYKKVVEKFKDIVGLEEAEQLAYMEIKAYFENTSQLDQIRKREPNLYNEIIDIRSGVEEEAKKGSLTAGNYHSWSNTKTVLNTRLFQQVGDRLGGNTFDRVCNFIIADWFVRCPLKFKNDTKA